MPWADLPALVALTAALTAWWIAFLAADLTLATAAFLAALADLI
jgi:hypothetical protein